MYDLRIIEGLVFTILQVSLGQIEHPFNFFVTGGHDVDNSAESQQLIILS
jgi:hypothetical protein